MATRTGADVGFLLVAGRNLLSDTASITDKVTVTTAETTPLGVGNPTHVDVNLTKATLSQEGFFNDAAGAENEAFSGLGATSQVVCYAPSGNVAGRALRGFAGAFAANYERIVKVGDVHRSKADYTISGAHEDGVIVAALAARTTAGNTQSASIDNGASSANGGSAYLQVSALTLGGYTNLVVTMRHSADNNTFADLGSAFTAVTAAPAAQRITFASTVNRYVAMAWAWTGSGSGNTATFMAGATRA